jgi:ankyrin repeat protein
MIIKAFETKHRKADAEKLRKRTAALRLRAIRRSRGLAYRAGGKVSSVGVEPTTGKDALIDRDALTLRALMDGDATALSDFVKAGGDPETTDAEGYPLLHLAVGANGYTQSEKTKQHACLANLLLWGVSLDRIICSHRPINYSAVFGDAETSRLLLEAGCNTGFNKSIPVLDTYGRTPLLSVMLREPFDRNHFDVLINAFPGAARTGDYTGLTPLMRAIQLRDESLVRVILDIPKVYRNAKDKLGKTALMMAASGQPQFNVCLMLLDPPGSDQASRVMMDNNGWNARKYTIHVGGANKTMCALLDPTFDVPLHLFKSRDIDRGRRFPNWLEDYTEDDL